jgi:hypothetical protein
MGSVTTRNRNEVVPKVSIAEEGAMRTLVFSIA